MDISVLQTLASRNLWGAITPEIMLGSLALLLLVIELLFPKQHRQMVPVAALVGLVSILGGVLLNFHSAYLGEETFNGLLRHTQGGQIMRVFFLLAAIMVCVIARVSLAKQTLPRVEFYHIVLVVTAAMMLLAQSNHLVLFFVALETVTIGLYILVSYYRTSLTLEAGLKYLIMGALSSSLMLFGIVLLYGVAGNPALPAHTAHSMHYGELAAFLAANPHNFLASVGIVLVLSGVAFKIGIEEIESRSFPPISPRSGWLERLRLRPGNLQHPVDALGGDLTGAEQFLVWAIRWRTSPQDDAEFAEEGGGELGSHGTKTGDLTP